jgi:rSAM/selenodomain-associated transferase 1
LSRNHLILFVKEPRMGVVKRRLARDIGPVAALSFYRATLRALIRRLGRDRRWRLVVAAAPDRLARRRTALARLGLPFGAPVVGQGPGDLGSRMARVLGMFVPAPAVLIGADIPGVSPGHIDRAFRALLSRDVVLGPASDGGYWLVGVRGRRVLPRLFRGVRWSGPFALADTFANLTACDRVALMDLLEDVDDGESFMRWRGRSAQRGEYAAAGSVSRRA